MAKKAKIGRPATGHDPQITIRVPQRFIDKVHDAASYMRDSGLFDASSITPSTVWREAIHFGLLHLHGEQIDPKDRFYLPYSARPRHDAEIHEAGHVVATFIAAQDEGRDPATCLYAAKLKPRGEGYAQMNGAVLSPINDLRIVVAGCAADAYDQVRSFGERWAEYPMSRRRGNDRNQAAQLIRRHGLDLDEAADYMYRKFSQPSIWNALKAVARALNNHSAVDGPYCWDVYSAELRRAARQKRKGRKRAFDWRVKGED